MHRLLATACYATLAFAVIDRNFLTYGFEARPTGLASQEKYFSFIAKDYHYPELTFESSEYGGVTLEAKYQEDGVLEAFIKIRKQSDKVDALYIKIGDFDNIISTSHRGSIKFSIEESSESVPVVVKWLKLGYSENSERVAGKLAWEAGKVDNSLAFRPYLIYGVEFKPSLITSLALNTELQIGVFKAKELGTWSLFVTRDVNNLRVNFRHLGDAKVLPHSATVEMFFSGKLEYVSNVEIGPIVAYYNVQPLIALFNSNFYVRVTLFSSEHSALVTAQQLSRSLSFHRYDKRLFADFQTLLDAYKIQKEIADGMLTLGFNGFHIMRAITISKVRECSPLLSDLFESSSSKMVFLEPQKNLFADSRAASFYQKATSAVLMFCHIGSFMFLPEISPYVLKLFEVILDLIKQLSIRGMAPLIYDYLNLKINAQNYGSVLEMVLSDKNDETTEERLTLINYAENMALIKQEDV